MIEPTWDRARELVVEGVRSLETERVPISKSDGRVLAQDVSALTPLPPFASSAMDGWAVCGVGPWSLVGSTLAGRPWAGSLRPGEAIDIATGAVVPAEATAVLRSEDGIVSDGVLTGAVPPGKDIRPGGEEAALGEVLVRAGATLNPGMIGLAISAGHDELEVSRRPRARLLVFGDELVHDGPARDSHVRDSLGVVVPQWLARLGVDVVGVQHVEDTLDAHESALRACADVDVILTTGGTAHGPVDFLHSAIERIGGRVIVDSVAVRPGHPMLAIDLGDGRRLIGLPGNPQSALVALVSLGIPLIRRLTGQPDTSLGEVQLATATSAPAHETRLVLATEHGSVVTPVAYLASHMLRGVATADGFAVLPPGGSSAGDTVRWVPIP